MSHSPQCLIVIPARMNSARLPGKPMADINGQPMIVHVWRRAMEAELGRVVVAAAEAEIAEAVVAAGGEAILTEPAHPSGSDRVFEAVVKIDPARRLPIVVNVQGDLPTIDPALIRRSILPLEEPEVDIATLACPIAEPEDLARPSVVKAAIAWNREQAGHRVGRALYFSRAPIPWGEGGAWHHIGLYAYRRPALDRFVALPAGHLEQRESLEQLRALEHGMRIDAVEVSTIPLGVDTPADLDQARRLLA